MVSVPRPTPAAERRAALYVRVSSRAQAESKDKGRVRPIRDAENEKEQETSIDTQLAACRTYALAHGYAVDEAHIYREVHTGVELWERAELARARDAVRRQAVDVVIAYAIDRLARDPVHLGVVISEAEHAGVAVEFVTEPMDTSPEGQLIRYIRGYAAKVEHEKIKERSWRGKLARVAAGKPLVGPKAPFGYQWADEGKAALAIDPYAAPIMRRIFRAVLNGATLRSIAMQLTADGIPTPQGHPNWGYSTISALVRNPLYMGHWAALRWHVKREAGGRNVRTRRDVSEQTVLPATFEPLITAAEFEQVGALLARNKQRAARSVEDREDALLRAGFARCGECGATMRVLRLPRQTVYRCRREHGQAGPMCPQRPTITARILDTEVWKRVEQVLTDETVIAREVARLRETDPTPHDLTAIDRARADVAKRRQRAAHIVLQLDDDAAAPLVREMAMLAEEAQRLEAEREQVLAQQATWQVA